MKKAHTDKPEQKAQKACPHLKKCAILGVLLLALSAAAAVVIILVLPSAAPVPLKYQPLEPPVTAATPSSLRPSRGRLLQSMLCPGGPSCLTPIDIMRNRIFTSNGPTSYTKRLSSVDERMSSLAARALDSDRQCLSESVKVWQPPSLPGSTAFDMYFQCQEDLSEGGTGGARLYFGQRDGTSYVAEIQQSENGHNGAVLAIATLNATEVHVWTITSMSSSVSSLMQIKATSSATGSADEFQRLELSFATNEEQTTGLGCGVQFISSGGAVSASGIFADRDCATQALSNPPNGSQASVCVSASDLSVSSNCADLTMTTAHMTYATASTFAAAAANLVDDYGNIANLGLTSFNADRK